MNALAAPFERETLLLVGVALAFALAMIIVVVIERLALMVHEAWLRRITAHYTPLVCLAVAGDHDARAALRQAPASHRLTIARLIILPLVHDRDPARIAGARALVEALSLVPYADRLLRSPWWWRRAMGLRSLGLLQVADRTSQLIAALDDPNADVRNAALDALADLQDPRALPAVVVRMHDATLHRARRAAVLTAYGSRCEPFLHDLAAIDPEHRVNYALALGLCGTAASRPLLFEWARDPRANVRGAALQALARIGIDAASQPVAVAALEDADAGVRTMAAKALQGCADPDTAARLARHLDDTWTVALQSARALQTMAAAGRAELEARATGTGLPALLARQMLWEAKAAR